MRTRCALALLVAIPLAPSGHAHADPRAWVSSGATTLSAGRWNAGLIDGVHWGATDRVELSLHPLLFYVLPHAEAKIAWLTFHGWDLATRHRIAYPTRFLNFVSREGAGGLLPANTDVPIAIELSSDALATRSLTSGIDLTIDGGLTTMPRFTSGEDLPLLDFPFLYNRFAALKTYGAAHVGAALEGLVLEQLTYRVTFEGFSLPLSPWAYTVEHGLRIGWRPSSTFQCIAGYLASEGRYPIGHRIHYIPYADVTIGW